MPSSGPSRRREEGGRGTRLRGAASGEVVKVAAQEHVLLAHALELPLLVCYDELVPSKLHAGGAHTAVCVVAVGGGARVRVHELRHLALRRLQLFLRATQRGLLRGALHHLKVCLLQPLVTHEGRAARRRGHKLFLACAELHLDAVVECCGFVLELPRACGRHTPLTPQPPHRGLVHQESLHAVVSHLHRLRRRRRRGFAGSLCGRGSRRDAPVALGKALVRLHLPP